MRAPREQRHRGDHAEQAAVERHAALPDREDLERIGGVVARLVEQHVAEPAADDDAEHAVEQQVLDVAAGPAGRGDTAAGATRTRGEEQEQAEADQVGQAVPVDRRSAGRSSRGRARSGRTAGARACGDDTRPHRCPAKRASRRRRIDPRDSPMPTSPPCRSTAAPRNITEGVARAPNRSMYYAHRLRGGRLRQADDRRRQRPLDDHAVQLGPAEARRRRRRRHRGGRRQRRRSSARRPSATAWRWAPRA